MAVAHEFVNECNPTIGFRLLISLVKLASISHMCIKKSLSCIRLIYAGAILK